MFDIPRWKIWAITLAIVAGIVFAIPSMFPKSQVAQWPGFLPKAQINLGLDLAGGSHLLMEADLADFAKQRLAAMEENVQTELRRDPRIQIGDISTSGNRVSFMSTGRADGQPDLGCNDVGRQPRGADADR